MMKRSSFTPRAFATMFGLLLMAAGCSDGAANSGLNIGDGTDVSSGGTSGNPSGGAPGASSTTGGQTGDDPGATTTGGSLPDPMNASGGAGTGGSGDDMATGGTSGVDRGLHVDGNMLRDGNGEKVLLRGPELVNRWGTYAGITSDGVDVPWEGGRNNNVGETEIREIGKTKATGMRLLGGFADELEALLHTAIVEQHMFVAVARVDWTDPGVQTVLKKYAKYVILHPRGEFTHQDANLWRAEARTVIAFIRGLGFTSAIEVGTTGYGQNWATIANYGEEIAASDPLKNTLFLLQLYSQYASNVTGTIEEIKNFPAPVIVDACLFTSPYGNTPNTYKEVWDQSMAQGLSSFYWDWYGDGEGNSMSTNGQFNSLTPVGKYVAQDSPAALSKMTKTAYALGATVQ